MTPDEVIGKLKNMAGNTYPAMPIDSELVFSAITLIQDYQKLRERVSVETIDGELSCAYNDWLSTGKDYCDLCSMQADAIVTYLQGGIEYREYNAR